MMKELSNKVCIVGVDESDEIGTLPGKSMLSLHLEATHNAIRDAGLKVSDIDGVFTAGQHSPATIAEALGRDPALRRRHHRRRLLLHHHGRPRHAGPAPRPVRRGRRLARRVRPLRRGRDAAARHRDPRPVRGLLRLRRCADLLRPHHHAPHARVRHHARAVGAGGRLHPQVGRAQPQGQEPRADHREGRARLPPGHLAVQRAEHLPGDRRRRRGGAHPRRPGEGHGEEAHLRARRGRGRRAREPHPDAQPHLQRGHAGLRREGLRHGRRGAARLQPRDALRRLHLRPAAHAGGARPGQARRGRELLRGRTLDAGRLAADQHQRRRTLLHPQRHVRHLPDHRVRRASCAASAARARCRMPSSGWSTAWAGCCRRPERWCSRTSARPRHAGRPA